MEDRKIRAIAANDELATDGLADTQARQSADMATWGADTRDERARDAAPELVDALRGMLKRLDGECTRDEARDMLVNARALLARIDGKE